jgi:hypothetical protein
VFSPSLTPAVVGAEKPAGIGARTRAAAAIAAAEARAVIAVIAIDAAAVAAASNDSAAVTGAAVNVIRLAIMELRTAVTVMQTCPAIFAV